MQQLQIIAIGVLDLILTIGPSFLNWLNFLCQNFLI
jgi:hypothetical protein